MPRKLDDRFLRQLSKPVERDTYQFSSDKTAIGAGAGVVNSVASRIPANVQHAYSAEVCGMAKHFEAYKQNGRRNPGKYDGCWTREEWLKSGHREICYPESSSYNPGKCYPIDYR